MHLRVLRADIAAYALIVEAKDESAVNFIVNLDLLTLKMRLGNYFSTR